MLYFAYQNRQSTPQIEYVFRVILTVYGVTGQATCFDDFARSECYQEDTGNNKKLQILCYLALAQYLL